MTMPRRNRRTITVDGERYYWVARFERSGHVIIQSATNCCGSIIIEPLAVMLPNHIADAIRFAVSKGWGRLNDSTTCWLGFDLIAEQVHLRRIAPNSRIYYDHQAGQWKLPAAIIP